MSTYYYATNIKGEYIFDNFPGELKYLVSNFKDTSKAFEILIGKEKKLAKMGRKTNDYGTIFTLTTEPKHVNRNKLFDELLDMSLIALKPLANFQNEIVEAQNTLMQDFMHNLTSLNTYSIQDLFTLVPQAILTENINKQDDKVRSIIDEKPNVVVKTLLKLIKYNLAMKVEFSVFERTLKPDAFVKKMDHSIRGIILSILQIFIDDFENRRIEVSLDACEKRVNVDYDSLFVSLYYLLDNSIKYCCPNTKYKIIFKEESDYFLVLFNMISIKIQEHEIEKLTIRGYRSKLAMLVNKDGNGIGMYRILKTLKLNDAELEVTPRINNYTRKIADIEYEGNQFKIKFKGQQDWYKKH